jgi:SNF2 family DNA or RNA helicase
VLQPEERVGQVDAWNDENSEYFIFILSTRAGGLGLNLQVRAVGLVWASPNCG